jgi:hypothetical protein
MAFAIWDWKKNPELIGKLVSKLNNIPPYGKRMYGFELEDGQQWYSWGYYTLVGKIAPLPFLTRLKIRCLGKGRERPQDVHDKLLFDVEILEMGKVGKPKNTNVHGKGKKPPPASVRGVRSQ